LNDGRAENKHPRMSGSTPAERGVAKRDFIGETVITTTALEKSQ
jgi:hypothetical protein